MQAKIEVTNLVKIFGSNPNNALTMLENGSGKDKVLAETGQTVAVYNVNFTVKAQEIFVIMGLSGSGKSTVLRCLNRLIEPTSGSVYIDGQAITELGSDELRYLRQKKLAMVFQQFALLPHRNVLENTVYGLEIQGIPRDEREQRAGEYLQIVGLSGWENHYPDELSGGMKQRVGLARALANDTEILLIDEAFSALDPLIREELQDELLRLQNQMNKTIVFITHDFNEALKLGDRIAFMKDGAVVQIGTPEEIIKNPAAEYVERFIQGLKRGAPYESPSTR
jgi:glycine betaine/proline transport system ATP-binding protein